MTAVIETGGGGGMEESLSLTSKDAVISSNAALNSTTTTKPDIESPDSAIGETPPPSTPDQPSPTTTTSATTTTTTTTTSDEGGGKLKDKEGSEEAEATERTSSDEEGYEEDDEGGEEEEEEVELEEEEELVVRGSMQFPLKNKATPSGCESDIEDNDQEEEEEEEEEDKPQERKQTDRQLDHHHHHNLHHHHHHHDLPDTVTRLNTSEGSAVYLVGTAHFSRESQEDVASTIRAVRPDVVVVELCKARTAILQLDEETILQESRSLDFKKVQMIVRQHGKVQGILYLLLLSVSAHITKQLGMAPGGEFRTAFAEARRSAPGCLIQLGDRPIQITLSRALASLSLWHKIKLTWHILTSKEPISKEEVEKCKQRDFILEMLAEMTGQFPAISEVFVKERDVYLCRSLQLAAQPLPGKGARVVVGVVGIGHVPGITEHWGKVTEADIAPIMRIPPPTLSNHIIKLGLKVSLYSLAGYGLFRCLPRSAQASIHSTIHSAVHSAIRTATHSLHTATHTTTAALNGFLTRK
ncbi:traB domain-containing protein-like isoform X2 [Portunus trituberculatus]|uniref:traB domain-containing protein-like isoform X2 n=1 Tax=Portunus trituberculatus TaxID=210409 RepID=UPI001E1CCB2C|nr:traB domain-containing protein-like isoform X2 [Portunus trituberculatus]